MSIRTTINFDYSKNNINNINNIAIKNSVIKLIQNQLKNCDVKGTIELSHTSICVYYKNEIIVGGTIYKYDKTCSVCDLKLFSIEKNPENNNKGLGADFLYKFIDFIYNDYPGNLYNFFIIIYFYLDIKYIMLMASTGKKTYAVQLYNHFGFVDDKQDEFLEVLDKNKYQRYLKYYPRHYPLGYS
jgi:hypothetical protein